MLRWWWVAAVVAVCSGGGGGPPRAACPPAHAHRCVAKDHDAHHSRFLVAGRYTVVYYFTDESIFILKCPSDIALDEPALPRFQPALRVRTVRLSDCWPRAGSYEAALSALNVTALDAPAPGGATAPPTYLVQLQLNSLKDFNASVLSAVPTLRNLSIAYTILTPADLSLLPAGLDWLKLKNTRIGRVTADVLARLPRLRRLRVEDYEPVLVEAAGRLRSLVVRAVATTLASLALPDTLEELDLQLWKTRRPRPWGSCAALDSLTLIEAAAEALPGGWLARCARLRVLRVLGASSLTSVAADALRGAPALQDVRIAWCALPALPAGLFDDLLALRVLHLPNNRLHSLPGELFVRSVSLSELDLSGNALGSAALVALQAARSLHVLHLDSNPPLDACPPARGADNVTVQGSTPWRDLSNLTVLTLAGTGTRRMCPDWRRLPRLQRLELSGTGVTRLNLTDLQFYTTVDVSVVLPRVALGLRRKEYESVAAMGAGPTLTLEPGGPLRCDCELYWTAAALRHPNGRLREHGTRCEDDGRALRDVPLDELLCPSHGLCFGGCSCGSREDAAAPGGLLRLDCHDTSRSRVLRIDTRDALNYSGSEPVALDLRLPHNRISRLGPEDVPPELTALDLRNNALTVIDSATVEVLVSRAGRRVWLAGNPLDCSCRAAAALAALRARPDVFRDWADAACADGTPLAEAEPRPCDDGSTSEPGNTTESVPDGGTEVSNIARPTLQSAPGDGTGGVSGGMGATLALGAVALCGLAWAALRRRRIARLPDRLRLQRLDSGSWAYDAFVSFAHADEAVVRELVERLEGGAAPLRLCVHYRDWVPGGWIPAQIAASVRVSRRTVAVVSEAFLRSKWARVEFREAYAAAMEDGEPRLVLVLLEDPARLQLDAELRAYISGNTYVRWGDPWFWEKLQRALPPPMVASQSEPPPAAVCLFPPPAPRAPAAPGPEAEPAPRLELESS